MSYKTENVKKILEMITSNEIYLPAIQRKFVWKTDRILMLFDSIMRGYPIGTFLFWNIGGNKKDDYTFYKFIQNFSEKNNYLNEVAAKPDLKDKIIGILDGQQRLSSMYVALQGTYAYKMPYLRRDSADAFPKRKFYINLFKDIKQNEDEDFVYEFKFLKTDEAKESDSKHYWYLIKNVLSWEEMNDSYEIYEKLLKDEKSHEIKSIIEKKRNDITKILRLLWQRLIEDEIINYFPIHNEDLDKILDIFIRVNSGGVILSKTDLLFSTIIAHWEQGREEIEDFIENINSKGLGFKFDNDFIMRSCLVLTNGPVLFNVRSFKKENILKIKTLWDKISEAISKTVDLLAEYGFSGSTLPSQNAIIPISYFIMKGGNIAKSKNIIKKYLAHAFIKQVFSGQGDTVLTVLRDVLRVYDKSKSKYILKSPIFSFSEFKKAKLPANKSFIITNDDIEDILEYKKGSYTFMILTMLYPHLKFNQIEFHQDHIFPTSQMTESKLKKLFKSQSDIDFCLNNKDKLPNLQIMEGRENESKNKTPIDKWIISQNKTNGLNIKDFLRKNYIPDINLDLSNFHKFYIKRKKNLSDSIKNILTLNI